MEIVKKTGKQVPQDETSIESALELLHIFLMFPLMSHYMSR